MGKLLIKRGWLLALLIHGIVAVLIVHGTILGFSSTTGHLIDRCTEYCEFEGCTHGNRFARFYPLVTGQVEGLYKLGGTHAMGYAYANILIYCVLGGGLLLFTTTYLLSTRRGRTARVRGWYWAATGILGATLAIWFQPGGISTVYMGCVDLCLTIGYLLGYSLYEVYTIGFVFVLPMTLILLTLAAGAKWLFTSGTRSEPGSPSVTLLSDLNPS